MKFSLFVHMENVSAEQNYSQLYQEFVKLCEFADRSGMHTIWTGEHHAMNFTIAPNPFVMLADLARVTKRVRLGTATVIAPFWHPIRLAGEAAMTDIMTDGRLELGIARGAYSFEYERLLPGLDAWNAGQRMRELVPAVKALWQGDYAHDGEFWQFPSTTCVPAPLQKPNPPLWVAARDPNSHEFAVLNGCNVQVTPLWNGDSEIESLMTRFNAACEKTSQMERPKIMLLLHTYVGEDEADVSQASRELSVYYNYFAAWFKNERPIHQGSIEALSDEEIAANPQFAANALRTNLAVGTPNEIIDRLKRYEAMGYDEYALWIDTGTTFERKMASLERFVTDVMPAFAD